MGPQGDLVQPEPRVSLRISIALTDGSSPSFSELFCVKLTLKCWTEAAIVLVLGTFKIFRFYCESDTLHDTLCKVLLVASQLERSDLKTPLCCIMGSVGSSVCETCPIPAVEPSVTAGLHARFRWRSQSSCMSFTSNIVLLCQVCLDPQQSSQWIYEDQRFAAVPALRHPSWDPQL